MHVPCGQQKGQLNTPMLNICKEVLELKKNCVDTCFSFLCNCAEL